MGQRTRAAQLVGTVGALLLVYLGVPAAAPAAEYRSGQEVVIGSAEVIPDDLYAIGETITIEGTVQGDAWACGRVVTVTGTVEGDLAACGQAVVVAGAVGDDVRIAGQVLKLADGADIGDDVVAGGFSLESERESVNRGAMWFGGYQAVLAGSVGEGLKAGVGSLALRGSIGGVVEAEVEPAEGPSPVLYMPQPPVAIPQVAAGLTVADSAQIGGELRYTSPREGRIDPGAQLLDGVAFEALEPEAVPTPTLTGQLLGHLRRLVAVLLVGLVLVWIAPAWTGRVAGPIRERWLPSLGWGVVGLVAAVVAILVVLLATALLAVVFGVVTLPELVPPVIGLGLLTDAGLGLGIWLAVAFLAPVLVGFAAGKWFLERILPARAAGRVLPLLVGVVVIEILHSIPFLGMLVALVVVLLGVGALWLSHLGAAGSPASAPVSAS